MFAFGPKGMYTGTVPGQLRSVSELDFRPAAGGGLIGKGVAHPPEVPDTGQKIDVGAYQTTDSWVPGCTFSPRC